jgi:DNA-directed RNA polymerase alpha subunit
MSARTCPRGHRYYKSSDCTTCPVCEQLRKPKGGFIAQLSAPTRRALEKEGIKSLEKLSRFSEAEILSLHGVGPSTLPKLRHALREIHLSFRK